MKYVVNFFFMTVLSLSVIFCKTSIVLGEEITQISELESKESTKDIVDNETSENVHITAPIEVSAPAVLLMEASTGTVIFEKDADTKYHPASVTKIMTLLLIFEAIEEGKIKLEDTVTTSEYAASMGGSQVFLEPGETQTVETMIKCIAVASANDACVAMAEHICGTEEEFVRQMNHRAEELGMNNTHFDNCNGLDTDTHLTTARDIALMSRELITKHPDIHKYSMIWMENITHTTRKGTSEFGLTNTNKLVRQYEYATGLKTGSTSLAKYCLSATAEKDEVELIAVVLAAPDYKVRFADATKLLNYGFSVVKVYKDELGDPIKPLNIDGGTEETVSVKYQSFFQYVSMDGTALDGIEKKVQLPKKVKAPVKKGNIAGKVVYYMNGKEIGSIPIVYEESVKKAGFKHCLMKTLKLCVTI